MNGSNTAAALITVWMIIYGAIQLFFIDPTIAQGEVPVFIILVLDQSSHIVLTFFFSAVFYLVFGGYAHTSMGGFGLFMLSSLIFSFLGTFYHDVVLYGFGILLFIIPAYIRQPPKTDYTVESQSDETRKPPRRINWDLVQAIVASTALAWTLLTHYGLVP